MAECAYPACFYIQSKTSSLQKTRSGQDEPFINSVLIIRRIIDQSAPQKSPTVTLQVIEAVIEAVTTSSNKVDATPARATTEKSLATSACQIRRVAPDTRYQRRSMSST